MPFFYMRQNRINVSELQTVRIVVWCVVCFFFCISNCYANNVTVSNVSVESKDGKATISIKISYPPISVPIPEVGFPLLFIVPGTRGSSDIYFDMVDLTSQYPDGFAGMGERLNQLGVVVVRFDSRGRIAPSRCLKTKDVPPRTATENVDLYATACWKNDEGGTIDFQTWMDDIVTVFDIARSSVNVDQNKIVLLGGSEGFVHASFALANKKIFAKAMFGIGAPADSLRNVLLGQSVHGIISFLFKKFGDDTSVIDVAQTSTQVFDRFGADSQDRFETHFKGKKFITRGDVKDYEGLLLGDVNKIIDLAKKYPRTATFTLGDKNFSQTLYSIGYLKDVYINDIGTIQPLDLLYDFTGPIKLYYGSGDHLVNVDQQLPILEAAKKKNPHIEYEVFQGLMHGLQKRNGSFPSNEIARKLVDDIFAALMAP
jgi:hypothetical protein